MCISVCVRKRGRERVEGESDRMMKILSVLYIISCMYYIYIYIILYIYIYIKKKRKSKKTQSDRERQRER